MKSSVTGSLGIVAFVVLLAACGGSATIEDRSTADASVRAEGATECERLGGTCVGAALSCAGGGELVSTPQTGCPLQGGCCLPSCPASAPAPNEPCSARGLRCTYTQPGCITSTCVGSTWYTNVYECPGDAGARD